MQYLPFYSRHPEIAEKETRVTTLLSDENEFDLPAGSYAFVETFCNDDECDCRRVIFNVLYHHNSKTTLAAAICWGWESENFYIKWFGSNDKKQIRILKGPSLNEISPQSKHAAKILTLFTNALLSDKNYTERIKKHYYLFKSRLTSHA